MHFGGVIFVQHGGHERGDFAVVKPPFGTEDVTDEGRHRHVLVQMLLIRDFVQQVLADGHIATQGLIQRDEFRCPRPFGQ
jgi:hypothetical protein